MARRVFRQAVRVLKGDGVQLALALFKRRPQCHDLQLRIGLAALARAFADVLGKQLAGQRFLAWLAAGVVLMGTGRGGKPGEETLAGKLLAEHVGKRARKGRKPDTRLKVLALRPALE